MENDYSEVNQLKAELSELEQFNPDPPKVDWYTEATPELSQHAKRHVGRPLGMRTLDSLLGGVSSGELIVISAPTSTGKTAFAQSITWNLAGQGIGSLWYSLEVSMWNFIQPFIKNDKDVSKNDDGTIRSVGNLPIYWPQNVEQLDFEGLKRTIRYAHLKYDINHVFIDHLHYLLDYKDLAKGSTSLFIGDRLRRLRQIAHETGVSIFLIAHMTKTDDTKEPSLNDLRDSSFVAQEADAVIMLYRKRLKEPISRELLDGTNYTEMYSPIAKCKIEKARRTGTRGSFDLIFENGLYVDPTTSPERMKTYQVLKNIYESDQSSDKKYGKSS